jgi:hypothetical protein
VTVGLPVARIVLFGSKATDGAEFSLLISGVPRRPRSSLAWGHADGASRIRRTTEHGGVDV